MMQYTHGPQVQQDGTTRFTLWAPNADSVDIVIDDANAQPMTRDQGGFYAITLPAAPGTLYRFRIDGKLDVPDPASRRQDDDVHDPSVVTAQDSYPWQNPDWQGRPWHETVLYELHPGLHGGYTGIEARLPALAQLGVTAIELMPIADFPGARNWGYDGVLPYAPDTAYGTTDELKHLIDTAHGLGIMVFLDVVYNHFGPDGNYLSAYAADFFDASAQTPWGPAIDFSKPQVRQFFSENALYWINEFRFDGLRLDAVHAIIDQQWLPEMAAFVRANVAPGRQVHLVLENEGNTASPLTAGFDAQWNDDAHHVLHHLLTDETRAYYSDFSDDATGKLARVLAEGFVYQGDPSPFHDGELRGEISAHLPPTAFVLFLQNHDQIGNRAFGERLTELLADRPDALRAAAAMQLLCPHIPLIFMGEERGVTSPFLYFTSHSEPDLVRAVRDGRRREFAGFNDFADEQTLASIPDPNEADTYERSRADLPDSDPAAARWLAFYRMLLELRRDRITPGLPGAVSMGAEVLAHGAVCARWRLGNNKVLTLYVNLSADEVASDRLADEYDPLAEVIFESAPGADAQLRAAQLPAHTVVALLRHE
ncbi:MAG: malto-oligosyltrehalose trehalohydrolase [Burkholderiaceae bacterium]